MDDLLNIGQWQGFFKYGPEYGNLINGKEAEFRLFVEEYNNGQFSGRAIDWEGFGVEGETAIVKGFIKESFISFTKTYPQKYDIDFWGNTSVDPELPGHTVIYEGYFDATTNTFTGTWEISVEQEQVGDFLIEEFISGTWRLKRQD